MTPSRLDQCEEHLRIRSLPLEVKVIEGKHYLHYVQLTPRERDCLYSCNGFNYKCPRYHSSWNEVQRRMRR